jgi:hypothetical protein
MAENRISRPTRRTTPAARGVGQAHRPVGSTGRRQRRARGYAAASRRLGSDLVRRFRRIDFSRYLTALGPALRRGLERVLAPRRARTVRLALPPVETAADIATMLAAITTAVRRGSITPGEAAALSEVADTYIRALETREFDRRLRTLEAVAHAAKS